MATINVKAEDGVTLFTIDSEGSITIGYTIEGGNISANASKYGIKLDGANIVVPSSVTRCKIGSTEANFPVTIASPTDGMNLVLLGLKATEKSLLVDGKGVKLVNGKKLKSLTFNGKLYEFDTGSKTYDSVLANNSWADIQEALRNGNPANWSVGDTKSITLSNGDIYTARLVDLNQGRYKDVNDVNNVAVFEFVKLIKGVTRAMNATQKTYDGTSSYTAGGWLNSDLRTYMNGSDLLGKFPEDLTSVMLLTKVGSAKYGGSGQTDTTKGGVIIYSDGDKVFVGAQSEFFTSGYFYNSEKAIYPQWDYYKAHNTNADRIKSFLSGSSNLYWNRSAGYSEDNFFCIVNGSGDWNYSSAYNTYGLAPVFCL